MPPKRDNSDVKDLPPQDSLLAELRTIDLTTVNELLQIRRDREVVDERLRRIDESRAQVSPAVYQRVRGDYESRRGELESRAEPLKRQGRAEYARLEGLHTRLAEMVENARLDKEELDFRHSIGEFDETQYRELSQAREQLLQERQSALTEADAVRQRFLEAFDSEQELQEISEILPPLPEPLPQAEAEALRTPVPEHLEEAPAVEEDEPGPVISEAPPEPAVAPPIPEAPEPLSEEVGAEIGAADAVEPPAVEPEGVRVASSDDSTLAGERVIPAGGATQIIPVETLRAEVAALAAADLGGTALIDRSLLAPGPPPIPAPPEVPFTGTGTVILPRARMVLQMPGQEPVEHTLGVFTRIGRSNDNHIRIPSFAISRKHAQVVAGPEGFTLSDLGSENGTFVNGEKITERRLADGDVITIENAQLVFMLS